MTGSGPRGERLARLVATSAGLGDRLPAPGTTAGSLPATLLWLAVAALVPGVLACTVVTAAVAAAVTAAGLWAAGVESRRRGSSDPGPVVVDEVAGQLLCFAIARPWLAAGSTVGLLWAAAVGFLLFRVLDVLKPWPICRLERLPGALGIMADDLAAGAGAGLGLAVAAVLTGL